MSYLLAVADKEPSLTVGGAAAGAAAPAEAGLGSLPSAHPNTKHGLRSKQPIIRALLTEEEAVAWDEAPVPAGTTEALEEIMREYAVMKYRFHAWQVRERDEAAKEKRPGPGATLAELTSLARALHIPLRGLMKAVEVHARLRESEQGADLGDAILQYLRTLPDHRLEEFIMRGEAPRFDPQTGRLLPAGLRPAEADGSDPTVSRGTEEEFDELERGERGTAPTPAPRRLAPGSGREGPGGTPSWSDPFPPIHRVE